MNSSVLTYTLTFIGAFFGGSLLAVQSTDLLMSAFVGVVGGTLVGGAYQLGLYQGKARK